MSSAIQFKQFYVAFTKRLEKQTGLSMGDYTALVLSGQNPSHKSDVFTFCKRLRKRRAKGKTINQQDVDALLDMVSDYMEFQELSGKDRVAFSRNVLQKVVPSITTTDLDTMAAGEVHQFKVTKKFCKQMQKLIDDTI